MIDWFAFSWEAFSTLVTGLAAVGAAAFVGARQTEIARKQTSILQHQVALDELRLRTDLFERRMAVYQDVGQLLAQILQTADRPSHPAAFAFLRAKATSRFLFRENVHQQLDDMWRRVQDFMANQTAMKAAFAATGDYGAEAVEREHAFLLWAERALDGLPELFGDELRLGSPAAHNS